MSADPRAAARQFVRSLNILLKFARLYEFGHVRTAAQFETTWKELRSALDNGGESGLLLGASEHRSCLTESRSVPLLPNAVSRNCYRVPVSRASISRKASLTRILRGL